MAQPEVAAVNATGPVLRDIHVPPASWWPPAPGWWWLAALVLLLAAAAAWWLWRRSHKQLARAALREIDRLEAAYARDRNDVLLAAGASCLLRRVALRIEPAVASTHGTTWRAFLRRHARDSRMAVALAGLGDAPFQAHPEVDATVLLPALRGWTTHALLHARRSSPRRDQRGRPRMASLRQSRSELAAGTADRDRAG